MSRLTKAEREERAKAIAQLREWIKPGDTVYTILDSVSRSGMSRQIRVVVPYIDGKHLESPHSQSNKPTDYVQRDSMRVDFLHPNHAVALAIGARQAKRGDGLIIGGAGMDMGFHLVYSLSHAIYPEYQCLGKGKCPSNYHVNHRERIRCEGVELGRDEHGVQWRSCYAPSSWGRWEVPEDWPVRYVEVDGVRIKAGYQACLSGSGEDGKPYEVCPVCEGAGDVPNPEGPERWDLLHTDGYAIRHRWL